MKSEMVNIKWSENKFTGWGSSTSMDQSQNRVTSENKVNKIIRAHARL